MRQGQSASTEIKELTDKLQRAHDDHDRTVEAFNKINEQRHELIREKGELRWELEQVQAEIESLTQERNSLQQQLQAKHSDLIDIQGNAVVKIIELTDQLAQTQAELEKVRSQKNAVSNFPIPDLTKIRDRTLLVELKLGKQAPSYKPAKKAIDSFIKQLEGKQ